jgi:antitoxin ParD1/3/4
LVYSEDNACLGYLSMLHNTSVSLGDHMTLFIDSQIQSGRYGSASEVVRAGLRLLESHEAQVRALQAALQAGEDSGAPVPFDGERFLARMKGTHGRQKPAAPAHAAGRV